MSQEQKPRKLTINGVSFRADEIKSVTIERNGKQITIEKPADEQRKVGFASDSTRVE